MPEAGFDDVLREGRGGTAGLIEEGVGPPVDIAGFEDGAHGVHAALAFGDRHGDGGGDGPGGFSDVVGVNEEGAAAKLFGGAGEFAEDEHPVFVDLGSAEFFGDQVHAVAKGGDKSDAGEAVEGAEFDRVDPVVEVVDGLPAGGGEAPVDAADGAVEFAFEGDVFGDVFATGDDELEEDQAFEEVWVVFQSFLEGVEAMKEALAVVEAIDAEEHLIGADFVLELFDARPYWVGGGAAGEFLVIHADGKGAGGDDAAERLDLAVSRTGGVDLAEVEAFDGPAEVAKIAFGLEAEEIEVEEIQKELVAPGEFGEVFDAGEGDVQEEGDAAGMTAVSKETGDLKEVVVVDPEKAVGFGAGLNLPGEGQIHAAIGIVVGGEKVGAVGKAMKEGPDDGVGKALIEVPDVVLAQADRSELVAGVGADAGQTGGPSVGGLVGDAGPAHPAAAAASEDRMKRLNQPAGAGLNEPAALFGVFHNDGQSIGDDSQWRRPSHVSSLVLPCV